VASQRSKGSESFEFEISVLPSSQKSNDSDPFDRRPAAKTLLNRGRWDEIRHRIQLLDATPVEQPREVPRVLHRVDHHLGVTVRHNGQYRNPIAPRSSKRSPDRSPWARSRCQIDASSAQGVRKMVHRGGLVSSATLRRATCSSSRVTFFCSLHSWPPDLVRETGRLQEPRKPARSGVVICGVRRPAGQGVL